AAKLFAELFERLRQPGIVGEILAGVVIGPAVLSLVAPDRVLTALSDLGVMFLLFRVGLEVRPRDLMDVGRTALVVASLGVIVPFVLALGAMEFLGKSSIESIFVAAALVATSVGVTAQILSAQGLLAERASRVILAAAVIDDVFGFIVLSAVSAVAREHVRVGELVLSGALAAGFTMILARWGTGAVTRIVPRAQNRLRVGEVQFNLAMFTLFGFALMAEYVGVAAFIGAFLAGMALSESLEERVRTLSLGVTELLTPFFLAGIGLHVDMGGLAAPETLWLTGIIVLVAVVSRIVGCGLGALRLGRADALRIGAGMVPRGEVGMVVAQIGLRTNVLSPGVYDVLVLMAVLTTLLAPVMLNAAFQGVRRHTTSASQDFSIG